MDDLNQILATVQELVVNLGVRPWVKTKDYWPVYFTLYERLKNRLDAEGISIPFPQRDIHVFQNN